MKSQTKDAKPVLAPKPVKKTGRNAKGEIYGLEGTNKTNPVPVEGAEQAPELQGVRSKYIPKTPYTRG